MAVEAKVCGLTRPQDAALAAASGAAYLGVIFAGGPRLVDVLRARTIVDAANGVPVLGVFGMQPPRTILEVIRSAGLAGAQLHGAHGPDVSKELVDAGLVIWHVARFNDTSTLRTELDRIGDGPEPILIEPRSAGGGGQGIVLPMGLAVAARKAVRHRLLVLAGGLQPGSVAEAIRVVGPDIVDVSSGIELAPGIKDPIRLVAFLEAVRDVRPAA